MLYGIGLVRKCLWHENVHDCKHNDHISSPRLVCCVIELVSAGTFRLAVSEIDCLAALTAGHFTYRSEWNL